MEQILVAIGPLISAYMGDLGIVVQVVSFIGSLRAINKPLFSLLNTLVDLTYWTTKDDELLYRLESNKVYKSILYIIDWAASIKLKGK